MYVGSVGATVYWCAVVAVVYVGGVGVLVLLYMVRDRCCAACWRCSCCSVYGRRRCPGVKTREAFRDLRVEPSGKVTAANSYLKHNPKHYNQTNRRALTKLCLGQAAQNRLSSCDCKAVLQAPDFTSFFSRVT